jgi:hypothetical protein
MHTKSRRRGCAGKIGSNAKLAPQPARGGKHIVILD